MSPFAKLKLYVVSADPGHVGLRIGGRVMVTVAMVCLALIAIGRFVPMNTPSYALGLITAIQGVAQINDATSRARAITRTWASLCGFIAIAGIALVEKSPLGLDAWLLLVVFLAAYGRRFGPRWQAIGVFSFMSAVMGVFLEPPERDLTEIALALVVSAVVAHLVREYLVPERPAGDFRRVVEGTLSLSRTLRQVIGEATTTGTQTPWDDALLIIGRLRADIRMCQTYLPLAVEGSNAGWNSALTLRLLDLQLATETALDELSARNAGSPASTDAMSAAMDTIKEAERRLHLEVAALPASLPEGATAPPAPAPKSLFPARGEWLKDEAFRQALQVTLACAVAMAAGHLLSSNRWFWAVMTAFLIFMNTQSGGAVAVRGIGRAMGTLVGIVIGIGLASLVSGNDFVSVPLIAVSIFGAFYLARISYAGMNVLINVAISLIYGLLGIFTPNLLVLRLEETAIGAAAGILAAMALFPVRTGDKADQAMSRLYASIAQFLETVSAAGDNLHQTSLTAAAGAVDKAFGAVKGAYQPMRSFWTMRAVEAKTRSPLRRAYLLNHAVHVLEYSLRQGQPSEAELQEIRTLERRLQALVNKTAPLEPLPAWQDDLAERQTAAQIKNNSARDALDVLSETLREIEAGK